MYIIKIMINWLKSTRHTKEDIDYQLAADISEQLAEPGSII